jgi:Abortive infection alpha
MSDGISFNLVNIDGEALSDALKKAIDGVFSFLGIICKPAAEETGLLIGDHILAWRIKNLVKIVEKSKGMLSFDTTTFKLKASPRVVSKIIENGSWTDDENLQNMWAGLLASSCTVSGKDESNLIYTDLLSRMTPSEACVVNYMGERGKTDIDVLNFNLTFGAGTSSLVEIPCLSDFDQLVRELNHLEALGLIQSLDIYKDADTMRTHAIMSTTKIALDLYVRCNGSLMSTDEYFAQFFEKQK